MVDAPHKVIQKCAVFSKQRFRLYFWKESQRSVTVADETEHFLKQEVFETEGSVVSL